MFRIKLTLNTSLTLTLTLILILIINSDINMTKDHHFLGGSLLHVNLPYILHRNPRIHLLFFNAQESSILYYR